MKGITVIIRTLLVLSQVCSVILEITTKPCDTEAVVGDQTFLNCSTSEPWSGIRWYYYAVGAQESTYIYFMGSLLPEYQGRARLEIREDIGEFNLVIQTVRRSDAGKYFCQEERSNQRYSFAELIVLDECPSCISNVKEEGVMGPNTCGFDEEDILLSCNVTYQGNIPPETEWKKNGELLIFNQKVYSGYVTSTLVIPSALVITSSAIVYRTTRSAMEQYTHSPTLNQTKILYGFNNFTVKQKKIGDEGLCLTNTSQPCSYRWMRIHNGREKRVSNSQSVTIQNQGLYRCEATCKFREKQCLLVAGMIQVSTTDDGFSTIGFSLVIGVFIVGLFFGIIGTLLALNRQSPNSTEINTHKSK